MKCFTKEKIYKSLVEQFEFESIIDDKLKTSCLHNLSAILDDLCDSSKSAVEPLNEYETGILRKRYGLLEHFVCKTYDILSEETNIPQTKIFSCINVSLRKIRNYSVSNVELPCTENKEEISPILLITIDKIDLSNRAFNCLQRARIFTLGDLVKLSIKDLDKIPNLGLKSKSKIVKSVHECGLKFALEDESKRKIERPVDPETYLRNYEILKEEEKIALIKQKNFLEKLKRIQLFEELNKNYSKQKIYKKVKINKIYRAEIGKIGSNII